jgi:hypothetical protein
MNDSKNKIEIIGASSKLPGLVNQTEPNKPKIKGVKKKLINLLLLDFKKNKQIINKLK